MYQALYRKYRSRTFDEVVGQKSVTQTLKAQVSGDRLSHAYLFTGIRGTGKTSCAKILARAVNCEHPVDGNPCNSCAACRSIEEGSCMDVLEIDAASNNGVDQVRTLRDEAIYTPAEVKKRVYIIDEVHMLSTAAFNALLKIIEEPPEHLIFILATTEQDKVPATILSRCQRFNFRRLKLEDIAGRINYVAYQEGIELTPDAAALLARLADGGLRDGLSLLDQCASSSSGLLDLDAVYNCLGLAGMQSTAEMLGHIAAHRTDEALKLFTLLYEQGKDVRSFLSELSDAARDLLIIKITPAGQTPLISGIAGLSEAAALAGSFSQGELIRMVGMLQEILAGRAKTSNLRVDAELCLIRLCNPSLQTDTDAILARLTRMEEQLAAGVYTLSVPAAASASNHGPEIVQSAPAEKRETLPEADPNAVELPAGFWTELCRSLQGELELPAKSCFGKNCTIVPVRSGDTLFLNVDPFQKMMLEKDGEVVQIIARKAGALLHERIAVRIREKNGMTGNSDRMDSLLSLADRLGDRMTVK